MTSRQIKSKKSPVVFSYKEVKNLVKRGSLKKSHTSTYVGYISRKTKPNDRICVKYKGKFGQGFKVYSPNWESSRVSLVTYYVFPENK